MSSPIPADRTARHGPVHVLYLIDQLCEMGGAERMLFNTVRLLPPDRFRYSVVTFKMGPNASVFGSLPNPPAVMPLNKTYDCNALQMATRLRKLIRSEDVTIVHTFFETSDLWGGLVAKLSGCPILVSARRDMGIFRTAKHQMAYRLLRPQFDLVLTVSEAVRAYTIREDGLPPERVRTLYNGLELDRAPHGNGATPLRSKIGAGTNAPLVACVGHLRRVKGHDVLLRAAAQVCQEFPDTVFLFMGNVAEEDYSRELQSMVESLGLERNVRFLGNTANVGPVLEQCDVFCLPSRSEGFSNALIEAMGCSLPCVTTRVGGNAEAIDEGSSGYLVESEDADALAERLLRLLRDPELRRRMGRAARESVEERFSNQAMMKQLVGIYDELLVAKHV